MPHPAAPARAQPSAGAGRALAGALWFASLGALAGWAQPGADLEKIRARAGQADVEAQNALGRAYNEGQAGLKQDYAEAVKWFRQAADKGFAAAQYNLGLAHELGHGVPADESQAFKYYLLAAEQGFGAAQFNVGNMYATGRGVAQDLFESNLWFKQAAEKGVVEAQFNLGLAYEAGRGVKKDEAQAARWYKQAADRGYPKAQYNLGLLLEDGRGVPKNEAAAAGYYRAAAEQGFAAAQNNYGLMVSEGRGGVTKDPVQAWVWLSLAAENGANPAGRDFVARGLDAGQRETATRLLEERHTGRAAAAPVSPAPAAGASPSSRTTDLAAALEEAREANAQFAEANQRLEVEKARLEQQLAAGGDANLIGQLRAQSQRLATQVQTLTADKEAAQREVALLNVQVKDAQQDLARSRTSPAAVPAGDVSRHENQVAGLTVQLEQATAALARLQAANQQLTEGNTRLQQEKEALAARPAANAGPTAGEQSAMVTNLQRDNARLNDEVKRSTRELLSLNSQLRALRSQAAKPAAPETGDNAAAEQIAQLNAKLEQAARDAARGQAENRQLTARVAELENRPKPVADEAGAAQLNEARQAAAQLQQQVAALQTEKAELEKWSRSLEQTVNEKSAQAEGASSGLAELRQKFAQAQQQVETAATENRALAARAAQAEQALAAREPDKPDPAPLEALGRQLADARQQAEKLARENQTLADEAAGERRNFAQAQARAAALERDLADAKKSAGDSPELADLKNQLVASNRLLEKNGATVAELTEANDRLEKELAAARQGTAEAGTLRAEMARLRADATNAAALREENGRLTQAAAETAALRLKNEQLVREAGQQAVNLNASRGELTAAQARVAELEKVQADIPTVRTRGAEEARKVTAELAEANAAVEKLNATVAELTGTNDRLEKDLENARKGTEAALAAQSQAVSAAQPDAYRMEIGTLQARVKELEGQIEEERNNSAKEVSTLAAQLTRTRDTNRSLTEANRALMNAKQSEAPTVDKGEFDQLQARVRDLATGGEELKQQNLKLAADNESLVTERATLRQQLEDSRKVATTLPGLADEKAALQERLEAVGAQLIKSQQDVDILQKENAEATSQALASKTAAEKAQADLAALQGRAADAEKTAESHTTTVAELTDANSKLETERNELRRQVTALRADNGRLGQTATSLEQLKTDGDRSARQNIEALTAQLNQTRRDLQGAREANSRLVEGNVSQERDRAATLAQLRNENAALAARLTQAQGTLDQIASAARLGTPASTIAAGGAAPARPVVTSPAGPGEVRFHTVAGGDSLSRISMLYYGTANRWQEIYNANRDVLQNSSTLRVGMQLRIP